MRHPLLAALVAAGTLAGCGGGDDTGGGQGTGAPAPASDSIRIAEFLFEPDPVTVKAGTPIAISNADSAPHTLTQEGQSPTFDSGTIKGGARGSVTFSKAGRFAYLCLFHPTMKGSVTVTE